MTNPHLQDQHARYAMVLEEFTTQHRPDVKHQNADSMPPFPQDSAVYCTCARLAEWMHSSFQPFVCPVCLVLPVAWMNALQSCWTFLPC